MGKPQGGTTKGLERLRSFLDGPALQYAKTRNDLDGSVTGLSPWIRHGALMATDVSDAVVAQIGVDASAKFVSELGWREYWHRVYVEVGSQIWDDLKPSATGHSPDVYSQDLPDSVSSGDSGLVCMDSFVRELVHS